MRQKPYTYQGMEPFITSSYDPSPLTDQELLHLSAWIERPQKEHDFAQKLSRIYTPLHDFYSQFSIDHKGSTAALRLTLRYIHHTGILFWEWDRGIWLDFICSLQSNYHHSAMPYIIAMAYSLGKLDSFQPVEKKLYLTTLVKIILGSHQYDHALAQLISALEALGYRTLTLEQHVRPALAAVMLQGHHKTLKDITADTLWDCCAI